MARTDDPKRLKQKLQEADEGNVPNQSGGSGDGGGTISPSKADDGKSSG